jgi:serine/threonine protein phosphatase PrpC
LATGTVAWLGDVVLAASDQSVHNALERLGSFASVRHSQLGRVMRSVAYEQFGMNDGDRLLIASDGLRCIPTAEVRDVLVSAATTARCIDTLVRLAAGSATDNSTVIVIEYRQSQVLDDVRGGHAPAVSEQGRLPAGGDTPDHGRAGKSTLLLGHDRC